MAGASTLLRNKRVEKVSKKSEYAEHGMRAAVAALQFRNFDFNANGLVEAEDIVQARRVTHAARASRTSRTSLAATAPSPLLLLCLSLQCL